MRQVQHIVKNKKNLQIRAQIVRLIREFFWAEDFVEVETSLILKLPGQEPYLSPMKINFHDEKNNEYQGYLHTSPEYTMKKMLAAGFEKIFSVCKCFRDGESFGGTHNPEFTMIEWYRAQADMEAIMADVEKLFNYIASKIPIANFLNQNSWQRISLRDLWQKYLAVDLDDYLDAPTMYKLCLEHGYQPNPDESYEDLFYRLFLNRIEPHLGKEQPTIVYRYPAPMAALAKLSADDPRYADRFEVYVNGLEIANAFSELTDADEQLKRLQTEQALRKKLGKEVYGIDEEFVSALKLMPPSAGIALGVDRLAQLFTNCQNIDDVLVLPMSRMF